MLTDQSQEVKQAIIFMNGLKGQGLSTTNIQLKTIAYLKSLGYSDFHSALTYNIAKSYV